MKIKLFVCFLLTVSLSLNSSWASDDGPVFSDSGQNIGYIDHGVVLADLDGDGDLDAFLGRQYCENDGTGGFTCHTEIGQCDDMTLGDVDGDGDLDVFLARLMGAANTVWLNDGAGNFTDSGQLLGHSSSRSVGLGDFDGDGDLDAFFANEGANTVWMNDGNGVFTDSGQSLGDSQGRAVGISDIDGDGDLDAMVISHCDYPDIVWINDGRGRFTEGQHLVHSLGDNSVDVALGDLDRDGDVDAFIVNAGDIPNQVWLNKDGHFTDTGQMLGSSSSESVSLADLDGDGDLDAFVGNTIQMGSSAGNKIWINDGAGNFSNDGNLIGDLDSWDLALGDLDGDGDVDAIVGNSGLYGQEATGKIWLNRTATQDSGTIILTNTKPGATITAGRTARIYGTGGTNHITLQSGAKTELINFAGSNTVTIQADASQFFVSRSGSTVTFRGTDGTELVIPATASVQTISFNDMSCNFVIDNNQVMLGTQVITPVENPVSQLRIRVEATPVTGIQPMTTVFSCIVESGDFPYGFIWDFGDGSPESTEQNPSHTYESPGTYTASVSVTDADGRKRSTSITIEVQEESDGKICQEFVKEISYGNVQVQIRFYSDGRSFNFTAYKSQQVNSLNIAYTIGTLYTTTVKFAINGEVVKTWSHDQNSYYTLMNINESLDTYIHEGDQVSLTFYGGTMSQSGGAISGDDIKITLCNE